MPRFVVFFVSLVAEASQKAAGSPKGTVCSGSVRLLVLIPAALAVPGFRVWQHVPKNFIRQNAH